MNIEFIKKIGYGNFSNVFLAVIRSQKCAIKKVDHSHSEYAYAEIDALSRIDHKNIIKYIKHFEDDRCISIILEYFDGAILSYNTHHNKKQIINELSETLKYLHDREFVHGDIAPNNVLINDKGDIKLIDFGLCKATRPGQILFCAPEMLSNNERTVKTDIWAFGILCFYLLTGEYPYKGNNRNSMLTWIMNKKINYNKYNLDRNCILFFKKILNKSPQKRTIDINF